MTPSGSARQRRAHRARRPQGQRPGSGCAAASASPPRDVLAFGDGLNDHEMLAWAGWGVAMGNAEPATQELADEVTASNDEDGVALVLERLLAAWTSRGDLRARRIAGELEERTMTAASGRIDAYLVCGGAWHDFDFARLELLKLLAEDERIRVKVAPSTTRTSTASRRPTSS